MERAKIFIASSSRALTLAEALRGVLSTDFSEARVWNEQSASQFGKTIIEELEQAARDYDFAVIILTQDDTVFRGSGEVAKQQARDNCIFEAGLFIGSLGRDRCFLVAGVRPDAVPVDLTGVIHVPINEPKDLNNVGQCNDAVSNAGFGIKGAVQNRGKRPRSDEEKMSFSVISDKELFGMEKPYREQGKLEEGQVVVSAVQPRGEERYEFAAQVNHNLENGIKYVYFFHASDDGAQKICQILQGILLSAVIKDSEQMKNTNFQERWEAIKANRDDILQKLHDIRENETLKICFLPDEPALEFTIHNANSRNTARAYLKRDKNFIQLFEGDEAFKLWGYLKKWCGKELPAGIFHSTIQCDIPTFSMAGGEKFSKSLDRELKRHFPEIHEKVKELCYT